MLRWTAAGAVTFPETLQLRLAKQHPDRIQVGAPRPSKQLSIAAVEENFHYFCKTLDSTRTKPCSALTLTGLQDETEASLTEIDTLIRQYSFSYVTCHIDIKSQSIIHKLSSLNRISVAIQNPRQLDQYQFSLFAPHQLRFTIVLNRSNLQSLRSIYQALQPYSDSHIHFLYPFPLSKTIIQNAPSPVALEAALQELPDEISVSGIPPCLTKRANLKQTSNRWYVDADHQKEKALLFFPDLLRYYKSDSCRFCKLNTQCDGFFRQYLTESVQLRPLS